MPRIYDEEKEKDWVQPRPDGSHDDLGVHPERKEAEVKDLEDKLGSPSAEGQSSGGKAEARERDKLDDQVGKGFTDDDKGKSKDGKKKGWLTKKKAVAGGGIATVLIGGTIGLSSILQGPFQLVQASKLLQGFHFSNNDSFSNNRTGRYLLHRLRNGRGHAKMRTRLGVIGNKIADRMELRLEKQSGLKPLYDTRSGNLIGFEVTDERKVAGFIAETDIEPGQHNIEFSDADRHRSISRNGSAPDPNNRILSARNAETGKLKLRQNRKFLKGMVKSTGLNKIASVVGFRPMAHRGGLDLHPFRRADRRLNQSLADLADKLKKKWADQDKNGTRSPDDLDVRETDEDGKPLPEEEAERNRRAEADGRQAQADARGGAEGKAKLRSKILAGAGIGIGVLCAARSISDNLPAIKYANIVMPLTRMGTRAISMGSQVMSGKDLDMEMAGVAVQAYYSEETGSWASARSIQAELGQEQTGTDIPVNAKPSRVNEKPLYLSIIDTIFDKAGAGGSFACSRIGQFALDFISGSLISGVVTDLGMTLASKAGINPLDKFAGWIVDLLAGDMVDVLAKGADFGNMINYGARLASNAQMISMGGAILPKAQVGILDAESRADQLQEFQQKNFFGRTFDLYEPRSIASKALLESNSLSSTTAIADGFASIIRNIPNAGSVFARSLMLRTHAAQQEYDYGFDEYGFTLGEQEDERFSDPYENALHVEPNLKELNEKYGDCFATTIDPDTFEIKGDDLKNIYEIPDKCQDRSNEELVRYRFYIADTVISKSLGCYEGFDEYCKDTYGSGSGGSSGTTSAAGVDIDQEHLFEDSTSVACAPGTEDAGIADGYTGGNLVKIRRCAIPGMQSGGKDDTGVISGSYSGGFVTVNSRISGAVLAMYTAAKNDGVELGARSAFRSMANQQSLCPCDGVNVARPGYSNHQMGLAIDFQNLPSSPGPLPGNQTWNWLSTNAGKFGIINYPHEAWHWSATGH